MQMSKVVNRLTVCVLSAAMVIVGVPVDTVFAGCPGANDSYGPCSDTGATTDTGGPGWCGGCTNLFVVFVGGKCDGTGEGAFDCNGCSKSPGVCTQKFTKTTRGSVAVAACYVSYLSCIGLTGAGAATCGAFCAGACAVGTPPVQAACAGACAAVCGAAGASACSCLYDECTTDCSPTGEPECFGNVGTCS